MKKIPRQVILLGLISLFTDIASEMLYPITPIFLTAVLGSSMAVVGIIEGIAEVTAGFLKGYFGNLSDKLGRRSIFVTLGYSISAISKPLPGIFPFISTVVFSRALDRIGKGIRTAPRDALLASNQENNTGAIFGFHRGMDTLGAALGPVIALVLLSIYPNNFKLIFLIAFIPSVFAVLLTLTVKDAVIEKKSKPKISYASFWKSAPAQFKIILVLVTIFSFVNSSDVFLILRSKDISQSETTAVFSYVFYNIVYAVLSFPMGKLSDRFGKKKIFSAGLFVFSGVYVGFSLISNIYIIFLVFIFYGLYAASTEGVVKAWVSDIIPNEFRGTAIGLLTMLSSFAVMLGTFLTGVLWDYFGPALPFTLSAVVSLILAFTFMFYKKL